MKWESEKENLQKLIFEEKLPYEQIGKLYKCTGTNIKKVAKRLGFQLPSKRIINPKEHFNKNHYNYVYCKYCGKAIPKYLNKIYCNIKCVSNYIRDKTLKKWENGEYNHNCKLPKSIKDYIFKKNDNKCEKCRFEGYNVKSGKSILQIHHIDGNSTNNSKDNLQLLCPNCHAMTENFMALNKGHSGRKSRYKKLY